MELGLVHRNETVIAENMRVYDDLIYQCTTWDNSTSRQCRYKITGIADWLFNTWTESDVCNAAVHKEWNEGIVNTVSCDPEGTPCGWEIGEYYNSFASYFGRTGKKINDRVSCELSILLRN